MASMETGSIIEEQALLDRDSSSDSSSNGDCSASYELDDLEDPAHHSSSHQKSKWWEKRPRSWRPTVSRHAYLRITNIRRRRISIPCRMLQVVALLPYITISLILLFAIFLPSYTHPPERYTSLRRQAEMGFQANPHNEKVFIAASLYDPKGELLSGDWGKAVRELVHILGSENVHLSIYENDPDAGAQQALAAFGQSIGCNTSLVAEHLDLSRLPRVTTPEGTQRLKRIAFLAEIRNRALVPLEDPASSAYNTCFDKLLYLNDVVFDPVDAANLLFSTKQNPQTGRTEYRAACAVDFINAFKFYDTFATRDTDGYQMGVPFYPWFSAAGSSQSRQDVLAQKDAVRVKSCWGGMVAFEAKWFQPWVMSEGSMRHSPPSEHPGLNTSSMSALRFRAETDTYWDGSECCLIHADLSAFPSEDGGSTQTGNSGIYMNPYIRVAYSADVLRWLAFTRRFERLYSPSHHLVNRIANMPALNPRRTQQHGDVVLDKVWVWDKDSAEALANGTADSLPSGLHGAFEEVNRTATAGQFCGMRSLAYIVENPQPGESKWAHEIVPTAV